MNTVSVNGIAISEDAIAREAQYHPASCRDAAMAMATNALVVRALMLQEARTRNPEAVEDDEDSLIQDLLDTDIKIPDADEATCLRYYTNNPQQFSSPTLYEAAHIFYPAPPEDKSARRRAEEHAKAALTKLQEDPQSFGALAKAESACSSKDDGGHLGQVTGKQIIPEMETYLATLEEGQICPVPVKTPYGLHVVRLDRRKAGKPLPFADVKEHIGAYLQEASWRRAVAQYVQLLAGKAKIEGWDCAQAATPLVQ